MPTTTYTALATVTLGTTASSVTFSSIPATYRDLILVTEGTLVTASSVRFRYNADSGSNYSRVAAQGFTGGTDSGAGTEGQIVPFLPNNFEASSRFAVIANIMDYSATDKHKTGLFRTNGRADGSGLVAMAAARWANTAAITTVEVLTGTTFATGTTFSLYGVIA
jgi:hypothetical protein